jgi:diguanylate cyclase (GGDEF)-like protein
LRAGIFAAAIIAVVTIPLGAAPGRSLFLLLAGGFIWLLLSSLALLVVSKDPRDARSHMPLVCLDVLMVSVIVWAMGSQHSIYAMLYYIPILYAITRLDIRSCIASSVLAALAYFFVSLVANTVMYNLMEVIAFSFSALMLAVILSILHAELSARKSLAESLRSSLQRLSAVYDVARSAWDSEFSLEDVLQRVLREVGNLAKTHDCHLALTDKDGDFEVVALEGAQAGFCWEAALEVLKDSGGSQPIRDCLDKPAGQCNLLTLPLVTSREMLGAVQMQRSEPFREREIETIQALCSEVAVAVENALLRRELIRLATTDPVTGLYNRSQLSSRLAAERSRAMREGKSLSLLMIDIDGFKAINDQAGHAAGDRVLRRLAEALRKESRPCDSAGRWGGDEFCLLMPGTSLEESLSAAERLRNDFRQALKANGCPAGNSKENSALCAATLSIGIISNSDASLQAGELLSYADRALYAAKRAGRDMVKAFLIGTDSEELPPPVAEEAPGVYSPVEADKAQCTSERDVLTAPTGKSKFISLII